MSRYASLQSLLAPRGREHYSGAISAVLDASALSPSEFKAALLKKPFSLDDPKKESVRLALANLEDPVILFFAQWCGHCKSFAPTFDAASAAASQKFVKYDADRTSDVLADYFGIDGFPIVLRMRNSDDRSFRGERFEGPRTKQALLDFAK